MFKIRFLFLFLFVCYTNYAQDNFIVEGQVLDINSQLPIESANVYFTVLKDSLKLGATTTDKFGKFRMRIKKYEKPVFLNISYVGHENYRDELAGITENRNFGIVYLFGTENILKDVVIKTEAPPIVVKKDTLEFSAAAFKVRPDDNIDAVIKELPGFQVDDVGKITVNGKEVSQILVNGKAFFGKDGAIALQNLPADIINKIQVTDFKTKKEELAGEEASSDFLSINLTIDKKKNKGYFGKFLGGYGTDDRYESSLLINQFDNKQRISLVASTNNINMSGFAIDDSFGDSEKGSGDVGVVISRKGITQSNLAGLNYFNEWSKELETSGNYSFNNSTNNNIRKSNQLKFLPNGNITTISDSDSKIENTNHKVNLEFEYKPSPTIHFVIEPKLSMTGYKNNANSSSISKNQEGELLNENITFTSRNNEGTNFDNVINFNKTFKKKYRNLSVGFTNNNSKNDNESFNTATTKSFSSGNIKLRDQMNDNEIKNDSYRAEVEYTEPLSKYVKVGVGVDYNSVSKIVDEETFNFDTNTQRYSIRNDAQSSLIESKQNGIGPKMNFQYKTDAFLFSIKNSTSVVQYDNYSLYLNNKTNLKETYFLPEWRSQIKYKLNKSNYALLKYDYKIKLPTAYQLLPVQDISSPVNTIVGNPDLEPIKRQTINFNFRNYNVRRRTGYNVYFKADIIDGDVISTRNYDEDGKSLTTFVNIYDTYKTTLGANWNDYVKKDGNSYRYGFGFRTNYSFDKGFINNVFYDVNILSFSPKAFFSYNYGKLLNISPSYSFVYDESRYRNYSIEARSNVIHKLSLKTTNYFDEKWVLANDFGYNYNSNSGAGFNNDFYLWNTSLAYTFLDKTMTARVKIYDVLNQNQGYSRTISDTSIRDEENTVLKRYAMFSLIYKIQDFAGMKAPKNKKGDQNREEENM
jgi:hypothetical protein